MATTIRLTRTGRKKCASYRVVVADTRKARDGRIIEILGYYLPVTADSKTQIDEESALKWMMKGARPSVTVTAIFRKLGLMKKFHEMRKPALSLAEKAARREEKKKAKEEAAK